MQFREICFKYTVLFDKQNRNIERSFHAQDKQCGYQHERNTCTELQNSTDLTLRFLVM